VPTVGTFPRADPTRASGSPSDGSAERSSVFDLFPCGTGSALAVDHQVADTEVGYGLVGGPGPGRHPLHPVDCKCQLRTLRRRHTQERPSAAPTATANPSNRHAKRAADADATDRITFEVAPAQTFTGSGYDLVTTFDCPHDMGDPLRATRHIRKASHPTAPGSSSNHTPGTTRRRHDRRQPHRRRPCPTPSHPSCASPTACPNPATPTAPIAAVCRRYACTTVRD
jgi:hypothetical protein